ncbi:ABC transporter substrate-binding protein [Chelativorans sp. AA-79]|uniref:ABC transporter substrate-binding protein n=1 Tax=Chelativorans sp. AA-79 TaxID=3028735 RepID=UPI0023F9C572|nr:ABC transporter substrate-binding protein [Chelativorans sp. AA-79]WEX07196.1 ABC transporter substrate-binding protein [Chelativorans sp. AA-79]
MSIKPRAFKLKALTVALAMFGLAGAAAAEPAISLEVAYAFGFQKEAHEEAAKEFMAANPDIAIEFRGVAENYEELVQANFREAITGDLPDVAFHGFNRVAFIVERGLAAPLEPFIAAEEDRNSLGYAPASLTLATVGEELYGLPFAISTPIVYYNAELVRRAGGDPEQFPKTWPEILDLAKRVEALDGNIMGAFFDWTSSANWEFIALVESQGGRMMKDGKITFDGPEGMAALELLRSFGEAGQVDMSPDQAAQVFVAGQLGILITSSARTMRYTEQSAGTFTLRTAPFPLPSSEGRLPAGGNAGMILARDEARQRAAWKYLKFVTGPVGQTIMAQKTGYVPGNLRAINDPKLLADFYRERPNLATSVGQLPVISGFFAFPGENSIKLSALLRDHLQSVVTMKRSPEEAMAAMVEDARTLLPE